MQALSLLTSSTWTRQWAPLPSLRSHQCRLTIGLRTCSRPTSRWPTLNNSVKVAPRMAQPTITCRIIVMISATSEVTLKWATMDTFLVDLICTGPLTSLNTRPQGLLYQEHLSLMEIQDQPWDAIHQLRRPQQLIPWGQGRMGCRRRSRKLWRCRVCS